MLTIALCEDDELTLDMFALILSDYGKQAHCPLQIKKYTTGSMLLRELEKNDPFDIYILDYFMPFMNGIEVAEQLRQKGDNGIIIFSTSFTEGAIEAFEVNAFRYLLKPLNRTAITKVMDAAVEQIRKTDRTSYDIRTPERIRKVRENDIVYIEKSNRCLRFHMVGGERIHSTTIKSSVKNAVSSLIEKPGFIMAGSSFVLNLNRIESICHGDIFFCNGESITPPRREYTAVKTAWNAFEDV